MERLKALFSLYVLNVIVVYKISKKQNDLSFMLINIRYFQLQLSNTIFFTVASHPVTYRYYRVVETSKMECGYDLLYLVEYSYNIGID